MNHTIESDISSVEALALIQRKEKYPKFNKEQTGSVLFMRMEGKTLKGIGESLGVTPERVRQIEANGVALVEGLLRRNV